MEVSNRFDLLSSLSINEEPVESFFIDNFQPEQKQKIHENYSTNNCWNIPEYVEKSIPCAPVITTTVEPSKPVTNVKKPSSSKKIEPIECEEQQNEVEIQNQPITYTSYPPQPYKFKQTPSSK